MKFISILFKNPKNYLEIKSKPQCFEDLYLDQILDFILKDKEKYNLSPLYYTLLNDIEEIYYRQNVIKDIETYNLFDELETFSKNIKQVLSFKNYYENLYLDISKQSFFLETVIIYVNAIEELLQTLNTKNVQSEGLLKLKSYLSELTFSTPFKFIKLESREIKSALNLIKYTIQIKGNKVTVRKFNNEVEYNIDIINAFERFKLNKNKKEMFHFEDIIGADHIQEKILLKLSKLFPEPFKRLNSFYLKVKNFIEQDILKIDREIQFYLSWYKILNLIKSKGLQFCYPKLSNISKEEKVYNSFDIALALKNIFYNKETITNSYYLNEPERIIVVTGPNQGGKTTFARMFGSIHYLAKLGLPIPGASAILYNCDGIYTHFEKEETLNNPEGKLKQDIIRVKSIFDKATSKSIIIINEIFNSTTSYDALKLGKKILLKIEMLDAICVYVTFIYELSRLSKKTVSFVSSGNENSKRLKSFKIERKEADKNAYALYIAKKYGLTYDQIKSRIKNKE